MADYAVRPRQYATTHKNKFCVACGESIQSDGGFYRIMEFGTYGYSSRNAGFTWCEACFKSDVLPALTKMFERQDDLRPEPDAAWRRRYPSNVSAFEADRIAAANADITGPFVGIVSGWQKDDDRHDRDGDEGDG